VQCGVCFWVDFGDFVDYYEFVVDVEVWFDYDWVVDCYLVDDDCELVEELG